jgi:REP element-mobilizing transposase RayT
LQNVSLAAGYLTRLSLESSSQAALITRGEKVWAYAGELPKQAADELADAVAEYATDANGTDLARFIHLAATDADYMLYATSLGGEYRLALVFDTQTPFSHMRSHVADLAKALAAAPEVLTRSEVVHEVQARQSSTARLQASGVDEPSPDDLSSRSQSGQPEQTTPTGKHESAVSIHPPTALNAPHELRYSFVLIPRLPKHHLAGDLATRLQEWLPELCLAFDWRLEGLAVQPEFVQWSVVVLSSQTPEKIARTMDTHLSQRIFDEFQRLGKENPSGQFWAQGFLVTSGAQASSQQILAFIDQTRRRQGVINPLR